jgi:D-beta-D-heptose 7-phosphate kinase/D-beta-D-heptose 1-phosphate adenosyltransferase
MPDLPKLSRKILREADLLREVQAMRQLGRKVVFTNGCFDILHYGHVYLLSKASAEGDVLIVGLNSDESVRRLKGDKRPINKQPVRASVLAALEAVSYVVVFEEDTPARLIGAIRPDVLVKGGDWRPEQVAGAKEVIALGGRVVIVPYLQGFSTTSLAGA